jgi:hypothetical protein
MIVTRKLLLAGLVLAAYNAECRIIDSFIRDDVKPKDFERLTENAKKGRTHLAGFGSGFFIAKNGYILTNHHVVENAAEIVVVRKDIAYHAYVVAQSKKRDLALLKINLFPRGTNGVYVINGLPTVPILSFADGVAIGQTVYAVGFPSPQALGFEPKVTRGIVSSKTGFKGCSDNFQMDATLAPGNSGGPVLDEYGHVVGVSVSGAHGASLAANYAINVDSVRKFIPKDVNYARGIPGRILRTEKMLGKVIDSLVLVLNFKEGACERIARTVPDVSDVRKREADVVIQKAVLDARMCKLRKEWDDLKKITEFILDNRGDVGNVREWNELAREMLGLHLVIVADADGRDVPARVKPFCGFKEDYVECGKEVGLYGGRKKRGFPVEAQLDYEDEKWRWRGELKCCYDWRGTKEIRVSMKRVGLIKEGK